MKVYRLSEMDLQQRQALMRRAEIDVLSHATLAAEVISKVKEEGDEALISYTQKFDGISLEKSRLRVSPGELERAYRQLDERTREALEYAAGNIRTFHREQLPREMWMKTVEKGIMAGEKVTPISDVCLYVPRGKGSFPSVMLMLGIPAVIAGVSRIVVCTPPGEDEEAEMGTLAAAKVAGIEEIYRVGGMQAMAAVAYGTDTVPRLSKVVGPGNAYVSAAKRLLQGVLDTGLPAGPSESIILADEHADPDLVALDLLIEAEHGPDSSSLLVTHARGLVEEVLPRVARRLQQLPQPRRDFAETVFERYGGIVITQSLEESIEFVNEYAPEHMEILTAEPFAVLPRIDHAGEILLGHYTPITLCNYLLGPNAILPTGSFARVFSGVSVHDFLKRSSFGYATEEGFKRVREKAAHLAELEGFPAHAMAVRERTNRLDSSQTNTCPGGGVNDTAGVEKDESDCKP